MIQSTAVRFDLHPTRSLHLPGCAGGNFNPRNPVLSRFVRSCYLGDTAAVGRTLAACARAGREGFPEDGKAARTLLLGLFGPDPPPLASLGGVDSWTLKLTQRRESTLRVTPLHAAVMGARSCTMPHWAEAHFDALLEGRA